MGKKKILVTGGAGYIGSMLVPKLLAGEYTVTVIDNFMYRQASLNQCCLCSNFEIINGDVRDKKFITPYYANADIIIPLAGYVGAPLCSKDSFGANAVNHDAVMHMLDVTPSGVQIIMPTTNSAYGTGDSDNYCDENSLLKPISKYAVDKVLVEKKLLERENSISLRLATVFGMSPKMRIDLLVNDFVYRAKHDKYIVLFEANFKRNFIHITDVCKAFIHCIDNFDQLRGNVFNVGLTSANLSKLELCQKIKKIIPDFVYLEAAHAMDPDQRNYVVSNAKFERTGWSPDVTLDMGINELVKGYSMLRNSRYTNL